MIRVAYRCPHGHEWAPGEEYQGRRGWCPECRILQPLVQVIYVYWGTILFFSGVAYLAWRLVWRVLR